MQHHNLLLCSVTGFYPGDIKIKWFRNGQEERVGVMSTGLIRNGDWTLTFLRTLGVWDQDQSDLTCEDNE